MALCVQHMHVCVPCVLLLLEDLCQAVTADSTFGQTAGNGEQNSLSLWNYHYLSQLM